MKKSSFSQWLRTPYGKLAVACSVMLLSWAFLFWKYVGGGGADTLLPTQRHLAQAEADIRKLQSEYDSLASKQKTFDAQRHQYEARLGEFWNDAQDGEAELVLRESVQTIATETGLKISSLGSVRETRINPELCYNDLDVSGTGELVAIMQFIAGVSEIQPRPGWRRIDIRPAMRRPGPPGTPSSSSSSVRSDASRTTNVTTPVESEEPQMQFSGALRVIRYEGVTKENTP